jgi:hypothetical protein
MLEEICQKIGGEWVLTGGSLIQLQASDSRATEDLDIIGLTHPALSETLAQNELFKAALRIGLSPETVNSAASFFFHQIPEWQNHLVKIKVGPVGTVFRPDLTLFIVSKLARSSEIDLQDISSAITAWGKSEFSMVAFTKMSSPDVMSRFNLHRDLWNLA